MAHIGFVGLGHMGLPMAINLVKSGHHVTGYDLNPSAMKHFSEAGGLTSHSIKELSKNQEILITMLQSGQQVFDVCSGVDGLFDLAVEGALYIDCSTIDVQTSRSLHEMALNAHLHMIDAPVSGGVAGAAAATLTFMVGGSQQAFDAGKPILECMGKKIIYTGGAGTGQAAKICNNMVLGISMIAISEAFTIAKHLDLSAEKLFEVMNAASGQCWALSQYVPIPGILENVPANNEFKPGFTAYMMLKDLKLSQTVANTVSVSTPLGSRSEELYQRFIDEGFGDYDFSAIIKLIAQNSEL